MTSAFDNDFPRLNISQIEGVEHFYQLQSILVNS